jgi:hypothetical protein
MEIVRVQSTLPRGTERIFRAEDILEVRGATERMVLQGNHDLNHQGWHDLRVAKPEDYDTMEEGFAIASVGIGSEDIVRALRQHAVPVRISAYYRIRIIRRRT